MLQQKSLSNERFFTSYGRGLPTFFWQKSWDLSKTPSCSGKSNMKNAKASSPSSSRWASVPVQIRPSGSPVSELGHATNGFTYITFIIINIISTTIVIIIIIIITTIVIIMTKIETPQSKILTRMRIRWMILMQIYLLEAAEIRFPNASLWDCAASVGLLTATGGF